MYNCASSSSTTEFANNFGGWAGFVYSLIRLFVYRNTSAGGNGAGVCSGFGDEVGFEVFDEAVVVGVVVLEMPEAVGEVEFAIAGYGFVEVGLQALLPMEISLMCMTGE